MSGRGLFVLVVGPSGAGKDTLIAAARAARPDLWAPRRLVTRAAEPDDEPSCRVSEAAFEALRRSGRLALEWRAHGLRYGLRDDLRRRLADGRTVVANVSRGVVGAAMARFAPCRVVLVTAPLELRAERLALRGREAAADVAERLRRPDPPLPAGAPIVEIVNDGPLEAVVPRFIAALPAARADAA